MGDTQRFQFNSKISLGKTVSQFTEEEVKNEPMLFSCDFESALDLGGPITREFIRHLSDEFFFADDLIIDSRVHMLMPGFWPAIEGFHLDDIPRTRPDGQPEHFTPTYKAKHCMMLVNGDICPTRFAVGKSSVPDVKEGQIYYKEWHPLIKKQLEEGVLKEYLAPSNQLVYFDWQTWHEATEAIKGGWRFFIRATINTYRKPSNELRKQVQVYKKMPYEGW
jgi:hypothetical protein